MTALVASTFEEALIDLIGDWIDPDEDEPHLPIISAMELQIKWLKEDA